MLPVDTMASQSPEAVITLFVMLYSLVYSNVQSDDVAQPALHAPTLVIGLEGEFLERSSNVNHPDP